MIKRISLVCILFLSSLTLLAQVRDLPFESGEKLEYGMRYRLFGIPSTVGYAEININSYLNGDSRTFYHAKANLYSAKLMDSFFKVQDFFESKFYEDNLRPFYFHRDINEGSYGIKNTYYWQEDGKHINIQIQRKNRSAKDTVLVSTPSTYDIVTLIYYARSINMENLAEGERIQVSFVIDDELFNISFRFIGKDEIKIKPIGRFKTLKFSVELVAGAVFTGKEEMELWVSDDKNRIPLLFESPIIVGKVQGILIGHENLKYPLDSKLSK